MSLDVPSQEFQKWIEQTAKLITEYYEEKSDRKVFAGKSPKDVLAMFDEPLPENSMDVESVLSEVREKVFESITNSASPNYFGYITGGGNQVAVLAEMIKASLNQNNLKWHSSPVSTEMEKLVMKWVAEFIGYPTSSAGVLLSGGSVANLNCLAVARKIKSPVDVAELGMYNSPPQTVYVSAEGHSSFDKAVDMLGIGKKFLRKIPADCEQRIKIEALDKAIRKDKEDGFHPICSIAVAGTTNTGAVDDLDAVADVCEKHNLWYHVDAAYGGPAAKVESVSHLFDGIDRADSVVVNPHKWMFVPFEAGGVLVKNSEHLRATYSTIPDYLKSDQSDEPRTDLMEYNLPLTKEFKALKVWMTLKAYGARRIKDTIKADIEKAKYLVEKINHEPCLELMAPAPLSIVCFRYVPPGAVLSERELNELNDAIIHRIEQDGRVFLTGTKINGETAMRVCFINHRTEHSHIEELVNVVLELGKEVNA